MIKQMTNMQKCAQLLDLSSNNFFTLSSGIDVLNLVDPYCATTRSSDVKMLVVEGRIASVKGTANYLKMSTVRKS